MGLLHLMQRGRSRPMALLAVPNVTVRPSTASVPTSYVALITCTHYRVNRCTVLLLTNEVTNHETRANENITLVTGHLLRRRVINPLECKGSYGATSNNMRLVH